MAPHGPAFGEIVAWCGANHLPCDVASFSLLCVHKWRTAVDDTVFGSCYAFIRPGQLGLSWPTLLFIQTPKNRTRSKKVIQNFRPTFGSSFLEVDLNLEQPNGSVESRALVSCFAVARAQHLGQNSRFAQHQHAVFGAQSFSTQAKRIVSRLEAQKKVNHLFSIRRCRKTPFAIRHTWCW